MSNKVDMRVNRYAKFDNGVEALDDYVNTVRTHGFNTTTAAITAKGDLLARIAELTPPAPRTVDEERLRELVRKWWAEPLGARDGDNYTDELVRRLIDALGFDNRSNNSEVANDDDDDAAAACNPHPDAPHGFDRNGSHNEGRYVCDCESWTPDERADDCLRDRIAEAALAEIPAEPGLLRHSIAGRIADAVIRELAVATGMDKPLDPHTLRVVIEKLESWAGYQSKQPYEHSSYCASELGSIALALRGWLAMSDAPHQCADVADDCCKRQPAPVELTQRATFAVDEERREKAVGIVFGAMLDGKKRGPDLLAANRWLDRITNSLGITVADPESATVADAPVVYPCADETDDEAECCEGRDPWAMCANCLNAASGGDDKPARAVEAVDVDADTLRLIVSLSEWSDDRRMRPHDLKGTMNAVRFALYRDENHKTRVVIGGGGAL